MHADFAGTVMRWTRGPGAQDALDVRQKNAGAPKVGTPARVVPARVQAWAFRWTILQQVDHHAAVGALARLIAAVEPAGYDFATCISVDADDNLYVADAELGGVMVYDAFGSFARHVAQGIAEEVRALTVRGGRLWVVLPRRVLGFSTQGRREVSIDVTLEADLVDAAWLGGDLYLLTPTGLFVKRGANGDAPTLPGGGRK